MDVRLKLCHVGAIWSYYVCEVFKEDKNNHKIGNDVPLKYRTVLTATITNIVVNEFLGLDTDKQVVLLLEWISILYQHFTTETNGGDKPF
eukprot:UN21403